MKDIDLHADAVAAYTRATEMAALVRDEWEAAGRPLVQEAPNQMLGRHPLWKALLETEVHALRFRSELLKVPRGRGRPPGAVSARDRVPRLTLKSVRTVT